MTTMTKEVQMPSGWAGFLQSHLDQMGYSDPARKARVLKALITGIDRFRVSEWVGIKRNLALLHGITLPDGLEPCWVEPGTAIYWQEEKVTKRMLNEEGGYKLVETSNGWTPTKPLPANNASQIAAYLKRGMKLRHPDDDPFSPRLADRPETEVTNITVQRVADMPEDQRLALTQKLTYQSDAVSNPVNLYWCRAHGADPVGFPTWKGYLRHCQARNEVPTEPLPAEIVERRKAFAYYCQLHNAGYQNDTNASRHIRAYAGARLKHPTMKEMEVL